jgi:hypothetical protein
MPKRNVEIPFHLKTTRHRVAIDVDGRLLAVPTDVWEIVTESKAALPGVWPESFGSRAEAVAFLRGIKVACAMFDAYFEQTGVD